MIFKYGAYAHDQDECAVRTVVHSRLDTFGRRMADIKEYTIVGVKKVPVLATEALTQASLTAALTTMEAAYQNTNVDFGVYLDDGTTPTIHFEDTSTTFGGTQVMRAPSYLNGPWTGRVEYSDRRMYQIGLRAEYRYGDGPTDYYSYKERLLIKGTGSPKWRYSPQEVGTPQIQTLQTITTYYYIQEGEAIGRTGFPVPANPLYPSIEHGEDRIIGYMSPAEMTILGNEMYGTTWRYVMEATVAQSFTVFNLPGIT